MIRKAVFPVKLTVKVNRHPAVTVTGGWDRNMAVGMRNVFI